MASAFGLMPPLKPNVRENKNGAAAVVIRKKCAKTFVFASAFFSNSKKSAKKQKKRACILTIEWNFDIIYKINFINTSEQGEV